MNKKTAQFVLDLIGGGRDSQGRDAPACSFDCIELKGVAKRADYRAYVDYGDIWLWISNGQGFPVCLTPKESVKLAGFIIKWRIKDWFGLRRKLWYRAKGVKLGIRKG